MTAEPSKPAVPAEPIIGIDLGTTNSLVAIAAWPPGAGADLARPRILPDAQRRPLCPSVVRFSAGSEPVIGYPAKDQAAEFPLATIASVKRLMGRSLTDAQDDLKYLSYRVVEGPNQTARVLVPGPDGADRAVSPQEVSALILARLRKQAADALGVPIRKAVVTVPAYFDDAQRQATRDAGRLAGLDVVRIVSEPTAAALAYGLGTRPPGAVPGASRIVAVYDFGGGTFDVSILRLTAGGAPTEGGGAADAFEVLSTAGDTHLGGDDIDHALVAFLVQQMSAQSGAGASPASLEQCSAGLRRQLRDAAERCKLELSASDTALVHLDLEPGRTFQRTVTRAELEALMQPLVDRTLASCRRALRDARRQLEDQALSVEAVVLVGGSTRIPLVRRRVAELFGIEPYTALDPDLVVALGAAVQASILSGAWREALLLDVIPLSLGIETVGGAVAKMVMRNSTVPARATERFSTSVDGQTSIKLHVLQGEREMAADCRSLGLFHLSGIPPMPAGIPRLRVDFLVDANGVLTVSAVEERSGKRAALQVVPSHGLSRAEVDRIEAESFTHAREDLARHRMVDLIANSRLDLHWVQRQFDRHGAKMTPADNAALTAALENLRALLASAELDWRSVNADAFAKAKEKLDNASIRLHEISIAESLRNDQAV